MSGKANILVADDNALARASVRLTLKDDGRFDICAEAADASSAVDLAVRSRPDLCLLDVLMPGSGIAAAWEINARLPTTKVVMLTGSSDTNHLFTALRAGADGYLLKGVDLHRLGDQLQAVIEGESVLAASLVRVLIDDYRDRGSRRRKLLGDELAGRLTSREWQVLEAMRSGLSTVELATRLTLSQATVRTHIAAILRKLNVTDRAEAIRHFAGEPSESNARLTRVA